MRRPCRCAGPRGWLPKTINLVFSILLTFFGLLSVTFLIGRVIPIDPVLAIVGDRALPDVYARVRQELALDEPLYYQFWLYMTKVLQGDFGKSVITSQAGHRRHHPLLSRDDRAGDLATLLGALIGVPMGVLAAKFQGRWPDHIIRVLGLVGYSVPVFWLGIVGLVVFYKWLEWASGTGRLDVFYEDIVDPVTGIMLIDAALAREWDIFFNAVSHLMLPVSILGYFSLAYISRMTRSFMIEQLSQEYVTAARVKGLSEFRVVWRHALGNAMLPLVTVIALSYASLLEGAVLTETVFAWPGLGRYITDSLFNADMNAVLGGTFVVGTAFIGLNLLSDFLYRLLDPRSR